MNFRQFAASYPACSSSDSGLIFWNLKEGSSLSSCNLNEEKQNILVHLIITQGEVCVLHKGRLFRLRASYMGTFIDSPSISFTDASANLRGYLIVMNETFAGLLLKNKPPMPVSFFMQVKQQPVELLNSKELRQMQQRMLLVEEACANSDHLFRGLCIHHALWLFMLDIAHRHILRQSEQLKPISTDRKQKLFMSFIKLMNEHAAEQHFVGFYANNLCVSPQYLNRVVKECSDRSVSRWIYFTLVGEISRRIEEQRYTMQQIADELHFADLASMTKFYKRETGYTLTAYRRKLAASGEV